MKIALLALCLGSLPAFASKPAPSLQNKFVAFFVSQDLDRAKGVYKDMPDFQKIDALQAIFDISDPSTMDHKFQESLARFLTNPINVDHNKFWKQLSVPERWQTWIKKQRHLKDKAKPLSSSKKERPASERPSPLLVEEPSTISSAARDVKGGAAVAAEVPEKPARKPIPADVISKRLEGIGNMESKAEMIDALRDFMGTAWVDFNDDHKVIAAAIIGSTSPLMQKAIFENWRKDGVPENTVRYFEKVMAPGAKSVEPERKKDSSTSNSVDATLKRLGSLKQTPENQMTILAELTPFVRDNFGKFTPAQKKAAVLLYASLPDEYHEWMRTEWQKKAPYIVKYFQDEHQNLINARKAEGR